MNIDRTITKVEKQIARLNVTRQKLLSAKKLIGELLDMEQKPSPKPRTRSSVKGRQPGGDKNAAPKKKPARVKKGQLTPEGRKRIIAAQRKRWAKAKAAGVSGVRLPAKPTRKVAVSKKKSGPKELAAFHEELSRPARKKAEQPMPTAGQQELDAKLAELDAQQQEMERLERVEEEFAGG